jgi:hypothetical protein
VLPYVHCRSPFSNLVNLWLPSPDKAKSIRENSNGRRKYFERGP